MKTFFILLCLIALTVGCASEGARGGSEPENIRVNGTTGFGVGSDTTTQTGIDTGTRTGSALP